jgi:hypothetical protein
MQTKVGFAPLDRNDQFWQVQAPHLGEQLHNELRSRIICQTHKLQYRQSFSSVSASALKSTVTFTPFSVLSKGHYGLFLWGKFHDNILLF